MTSFSSVPTRLLSESILSMREPEPRWAARASNNVPTIEQVRLACRRVEEMLAAGVTESIGIRLLEEMTEIYAKAQRGHGIMPLPARDVDLRSEALFARLGRGRA